MTPNIPAINFLQIINTHVAIKNSFIDILVNESTFIPAGHQHRLTNPGQDVCVLIEVQTGGYLGEDDIVRLEDRYGRAPN